MLSFLFEPIKFTVQAITSVLADIKAIICDGNQVNQAFFEIILYG